MKYDFDNKTKALCGEHALCIVRFSFGKMIKHEFVKFSYTSESQLKNKENRIMLN